MGFGDEIMLAGRARVQQQTDPRKCIATYQGKPKWSPIWEHNPRMARPSDVGDYQEVIARGPDNQRPYHTAKTPERWHYNLDFRPDVGEIYFSGAEIDFGARYRGLIIIEPNIKNGASPNKQWGWERWQSLAELAAGAGIQLHQVGGPGTKALHGVKMIHTPDFRHACAVLANSRAAVLPEGGLMHAAAALAIPGVIIFGGFTPIELTGYPMHRNLGASLTDACGMRIPCPHCAKWMAAITPKLVFNNLEEILNA